MGGVSDVDPVNFLRLCCVADYLATRSGTAFTLAYGGSMVWS
jgi:hypothetical protein